MVTLNYKYHEYIDSYINKVRNKEIRTSKDIKKAMDLVELKLDNEDVFIDSDKIYDAKRIIEENFNIKLLDWQLFIIALVHCYYKSKDTVVFDEFLIMMGRGNGKNGFISPLIWYLTTPNHGIKGYNIDIVANSEDQAKVSFIDVHNMLEENWGTMRSGYSKTKMEIMCKPTNSYIKYNTSNANTKDGKRSAGLVFDEIHEYENYDTINVFTSGFGKRKHSRIFKITTNGYVRGGVLDQELELAEDILNNKGGVGEILSTLPLLYRLDDEEEAKDPGNWIKANPSINAFSHLEQEVKKHWINTKYKPGTAIEFYTKRMNIPKEDTYSVVAEWEDIKACTREIIDLDDFEGADCIGGIDYASIKDFCSVGLLFKKDGKRYWYEHTFVNKKALEVKDRDIKFPVMEMVDKGLITIVNTETIRPELIAEWFSRMAARFNIINIAADDFKATYLGQAFANNGLPLEIVRYGYITHTKLSPLVDSLFAERTLIWGDNPTMNWYTNNTFKDYDKKGNITYKKIEPVLRKTDGFFALIHALTLDDELEENQDVFFFDVYTN